MALVVAVLVGTSVLGVGTRRGGRTPVSCGWRPTEPVPDSESAPDPAQWAVTDSDGVPTGQWWSSAVVGPGSEVMWAGPLAARVTPYGDVQISNRPPVRRDDGTTATPFVADVVVPGIDGSRATSVTGWGSLHVALRVGAGGRALDLLLASGDPFVELAFVGRPVTLEILDGSLVRSQPDAVEIVQHGRSWVVGADRPMTWSYEAGRLVATPVGANGDDAIGVAVGPVPEELAAGVDWTAEAAAVARNPVVDTTERLDVDGFGQVTQTLEVERRQPSASWWALRSHHATDRAGVDQVGTFDDPTGEVALARLDSVVSQWGAAPVLWGAVDLGRVSGATGGWGATLGSDLDTGPAASDGSYFGGTRIAYAAATADLADAAGDGAARRRALSEVRDSFARLTAAADADRGVTFDERWGSVVISPAEFGSGVELSDHHLQYGYWVAAAGTLAAADPEWAGANGALIDALIADYGGRAFSACDANGRDVERHWDAYAGHSWASGTAPFADGNNLESSSESIHSWWAAARWSVTTGRPALAEPFLARMVIESDQVRRRWLPVDTDLAGRPFTGIVWGAKTDLGTWFDPAVESALGIQLIPLGPASLLRYADGAALDAATNRWRWCDAEGSGCDARWGNLLTSDAIAAGHPGPGATPDPEPSTSVAMLSWWTALWALAPESGAADCSPGAVARDNGRGALVVLATNPAPTPAELVCRDADGNEVWRHVLEPGARVLFTP